MNDKVVGGAHAAEKKQLAQRLRAEMTPAEARLWEWLRRNALGGLHFRRQQVIEGFIVDFYCHAGRLAVELDGSVHNQTADYDRERSAILETRDIQTLRFSNDQVEQQLDAVLEQINRVATSRLSGPLRYHRRNAAARRKPSP